MLRSREAIRRPLMAFSQRRSSSLRVVRPSARVEYASAHLLADAAFEQAVGSQMARRNGGASGDLAWVASEGRTKGQFKGREVDRVTTETMVLRRISGAWKIVHVHWSSHAVTAAH